MKSLQNMHEWYVIQKSYAWILIFCAKMNVIFQEHFEVGVYYFLILILETLRGRDTSFYHFHLSFHIVTDMCKIINKCLPEEYINESTSQL